MDLHTARAASWGKLSTLQPPGKSRSATIEVLVLGFFFSVFPMTLFTFWWNLGAGGAVFS
jgi:hypothetical protein